MMFSAKPPETTFQLHKTVSLVFFLFLMIPVRAFSQPATPTALDQPDASPTALAADSENGSDQSLDEQGNGDQAAAAELLEMEQLEASSDQEVDAEEAVELPNPWEFSAIEGLPPPAPNRHLAPESPPLIFTSKGWENAPDEIEPDVVNEEFDLPTLPVLRSKFDIPVDYNEAVEYWLKFLTGRGKRVFRKWLARSRRYIEVLKPVLREHGLPEDTVYLAMIESGFSPYAYSWARAAGVWQFIKPTGKTYGLRCDFWLDERRDVLKSTEAAARFLNDLYDRFGDWRLAWAAYNAGPGTITRAVGASESVDFWDLRETRKLRRETKHYVPKLIAAAMISKSPEKYGFGDVVFQESFRFDTVEVEGMVDFHVIARLAGVTYQQVKELNPAYRRGCTAPHTVNTIYLPKGRAAAFRQAYAKTPPEERMVRKKHVVRKGETLAGIAHKYNTRVEAINADNGKLGKRLRAGQSITVPVLPEPGMDRIDRSSRRRRGRWVPRSIVDYKPDPNLAGKYHRVRRGENPWTIAAKYGLPVEVLLKLNGISPGNVRYIKVGQRLLLGPKTKAQKAKIARIAQKSSASKSGSGPKRKGTGKKKTVSYVVKPGDSLWAIAQKFGVSVYDIRKQNRLRRRSRIYPGQKLKITYID